MIIEALRTPEARFVDLPDFEYEPHYLDDLPLKEIAIRLDLPLGTVKSRLHYARERLRETIERTSNG